MSRLAAIALTLILVACSEEPASPDPDAASSDAMTIDAPAVDVGEDASPAPPSALFFAGRPLSIAHRGGSREAPENTLPAFANAAALGVDVLEGDLHATSDGVIVMMHDATVDDTTDGTGAIADMTFDALRALDAGYRFTPDGGATYPYRGQGVQVPTLLEVLTAHPDHLFSLEIKQESPPIEQAVLDVLDEAGARDRVLIVSRFDEVMPTFRALAPDVVTGATSVEIAQFLMLDDTAEATYVPPCDALQLPVTPDNLGSVAPELLARAHRLGMVVQVWTVNDRGLMEDLALTDVDGVMTDAPSMLLEVLAGP